VQVIVTGTASSIGIETAPALAGSGAEVPDIPAEPDRSISVRPADRLNLVGDKARSHGMPNYRAGDGADGREDQHFGSEFREAVAADHAVDRCDHNGAGDCDDDAQGWTIAALDELGGDEADEQADRGPTSEDDNWHGFLQRVNLRPTRFQGACRGCEVGLALRKRPLVLRPTI